MRVLVTGGRTFNDRWWLYAGLQLLHDQYKITEVIEGGAAGADTIARDWARLKAINIQTVSADWERYGRAAGYIRNGQMAKLEPDLVLACPGGAGTANMVKIAKASGLKVAFLDKMPVAKSPQNDLRALPRRTTM